jgi:hypothetical protein
MSNSVISSLTNLLDRPVISSIASRIGESDLSVLRGLRPTITAILGGLAEKTNDAGVMRSVFEMIDGVPSEAVSTEKILNLASSGAAGSPLFDAGRRLVPILLNGKEETITAAIQETSGLTSAGVARLMAAVTPVVLGFWLSGSTQRELVCASSPVCCGLSSQKSGVTYLLESSALRLQLPQ